MQEYLVERYENDTHKLEIHADTDSPNPREDSNCWLGTMVCKHSGYTLGDIEAENIDHYNSWDEWFDNELGDDVIALPLYIYDHSGISIRTYPFSCPWDSGQVGYIYVTNDNVRKEFGVERISKKLFKKVVNILTAEVKHYDNWGRGDVYGFTLSKKCSCTDCGDAHLDVIDSCWGFYGTDWENNGLAESLPDIGIELLKEPLTI